MEKYQHKRGVIKDNVIKALLHDPLFKKRVEQSHKGKGSYQRKDKHGKKYHWETSNKSM